MTPTRYGKGPKGLVVLSMAVIFLGMTGTGTWTNVQADPPASSGIWLEGHFWTGTCQGRPVHSYFHVNETALRFTVDIEFDAGDDFPGAELALYGPDSFVIDTMSISKTSFHLDRTDLEKRGLWDVTISMNACGLSRPIWFEARVNVTNRYLTAPEANTTIVVQGEAVRFSMAGLQLGYGEKVRLDLGNGTITDWSSSDERILTFDSPDELEIRASIMLPDGTSTGWSEPLSLVVERYEDAGPDRPTFSQQGAAMALALLGFLCLVAFLVRPR